MTPLLKRQMILGFIFLLLIQPVSGAVFPFFEQSPHLFYLSHFTVRFNQEVLAPAGDVFTGRSSSHRAATKVFRWAAAAVHTHTPDLGYRSTLIRTASDQVLKVHSHWMPRVLQRAISITTHDPAMAHYEDNVVVLHHRTILAYTWLIFFARGLHNRGTLRPLRTTPGTIFQIHLPIYEASSSPRMAHRTSGMIDTLWISELHRWIHQSSWAGIQRAALNNEVPFVPADQQDDIRQRILGHTRFAFLQYLEQEAAPNSPVEQAPFECILEAAWTAFQTLAETGSPISRESLIGQLRGTIDQAVQTVLNLHGQNREGAQVFEDGQWQPWTYHTEAHLTFYARTVVEAMLDALVTTVGTAAFESVNRTNAMTAMRAAGTQAHREWNGWQRLGGGTLGVISGEAPSPRIIISAKITHTLLQLSAWMHSGFPMPWPTFLIGQTTFQRTHRVVIGMVQGPRPYPMTPAPLIVCSLPIYSDRGRPRVMGVLDIDQHLYTYGIAPISCFYPGRLRAWADLGNTLSPLLQSTPALDQARGLVIAYYRNPERFPPESMARIQRILRGLSRESVQRIRDARKQLLADAPHYHSLTGEQEEELRRWIDATEPSRLQLHERLSRFVGEMVSGSLTNAQIQNCLTDLSRTVQETPALYPRTRGLILMYQSMLDIPDQNYQLLAPRIADLQTAIEQDLAEWFVTQLHEPADTEWVSQSLLPERLLGLLRNLQSEKIDSLPVGDLIRFLDQWSSLSLSIALQDKLESTIDIPVPSDPRYPSFFSQNVALPPAQQARAGTLGLLAPSKENGNWTFTPWNAAQAAWGYDGWSVDYPSQMPAQSDAILVAASAMANGISIPLGWTALMVAEQTHHDPRLLLMGPDGSCHLVELHIAEQQAAFLQALAQASWQALQNPAQQGIAAQRQSEEIGTAFFAPFGSDQSQQLDVEGRDASSANPIQSWISAQRDSQRTAQQEITQRRRTAARRRELERTAARRLEEQREAARREQEKAQQAAPSPDQTEGKALKEIPYLLKQIQTVITRSAGQDPDTALANVRAQITRSRLQEHPILLAAIARAELLIILPRLEGLTPEHVSRDAMMIFHERPEVVVARRAYEAWQIYAPRAQDSIAGIKGSEVQALRVEAGVQPDFVVRARESFVRLTAMQAVALLAFDPALDEPSRAALHRAIQCLWGLVGVQDEDERSEVGVFAQDPRGWVMAHGRAQNRPVLPENIWQIMSDWVYSRPELVPIGLFIPLPPGVRPLLALPAPPRDLRTDALTAAAQVFESNGYHVVLPDAPVPETNQTIRLGVEVRPDRQRTDGALLVRIHVATFNVQALQDLNALVSSHGNRQEELDNLIQRMRLLLVQQGHAVSVVSISITQHTYRDVFPAEDSPADNEALIIPETLAERAETLATHLLQAEGYHVIDPEDSLRHDDPQSVLLQARVEPNPNNPHQYEVLFSLTTRNSQGLARLVGLLSNPADRKTLSGYMKRSCGHIGCVVHAITWSIRTPRVPTGNEMRRDEAETYFPIGQEVQATLSRTIGAHGIFARVFLPDGRSVYALMSTTTPGFPRTHLAQLLRRGRCLARIQAVVSSERHSDLPTLILTYQEDLSAGTLRPIETDDTDSSVMDNTQGQESTASSELKPVDYQQAAEAVLASAAWYLGTQGWTPIGPNDPFGQQDMRHVALEVLTEPILEGGIKAVAIVTTLYRKIADDLEEITTTRTRLEQYCGAILVRLHEEGEHLDVRRVVFTYRITRPFIAGDGRQLQPAAWPFEQVVAFFQEHPIVPVEFVKNKNTGLLAAICLNPHQFMYAFLPMRYLATYSGSIDDLFAEGGCLARVVSIQRSPENPDRARISIAFWALNHGPQLSRDVPAVQILDSMASSPARQSSHLYGYAAFDRPQETPPTPRIDTLSPRDQRVAILSLIEGGHLADALDLALELPLRMTVDPKTDSRLTYTVLTRLKALFRSDIHSPDIARLLLIGLAGRPFTRDLWAYYRDWIRHQPTVESRESALYHYKDLAFFCLSFDAANDVARQAYFWAVGQLFILSTSLETIMEESMESASPTIEEPMTSVRTRPFRPLLTTFFRTPTSLQILGFLLGHPEYSRLIFRGPIFRRRHKPAARPTLQTEALAVVREVFDRNYFIVVPEWNDLEEDNDQQVFIQIEVLDDGLTEPGTDQKIIHIHIYSHSLEVRRYFRQLTRQRGVTSDLGGNYTFPILRELADRGYRIGAALLVVHDDAPASQTPEALTAQDVVDAAPAATNPPAGEPAAEEFHQPAESDATAAPLARRDYAAAIREIRERAYTSADLEAILARHEITEENITADEALGAAVRERRAMFARIAQSLEREPVRPPSQTRRPIPDEETTAREIESAIRSWLTDHGYVDDHAPISISWQIRPPTHGSLRIIQFLIRVRDESIRDELVRRGRSLIREVTGRILENYGRYESQRWFQMNVFVATEDQEVEWDGQAPRQASIDSGTQPTEIRPEVIEEQEPPQLSAEAGENHLGTLQGSSADTVLDERTHEKSRGAKRRAQARRHRQDPHDHEESDSDLQETTEPSHSQTLHILLPRDGDPEEFIIRATDLLMGIALIPRIVTLEKARETISNGLSAAISIAEQVGLTIEGIAQAAEGDQRLNGRLAAYTPEGMILFQHTPMLMGFIRLGSIIAEYAEAATSAGAEQENPHSLGQAA